MKKSLNLRPKPETKVVNGRTYYIIAKTNKVFEEWRVSVGKYGPRKFRDPSNRIKAKKKDNYKAMLKELERVI
jgi:hypothetical protein